MTKEFNLVDPHFACERNISRLNKPKSVVFWGICNRPVAIQSLIRKSPERNTEFVDYQEQVTDFFSSKALRMKPDMLDAQYTSLRQMVMSVIVYALYAVRAIE